MKHRIVSILIAGYLLSCIILGGSSQSPWTNLALQLGGIALIALAAVAGKPENEGSTARAVNILLACTLLLVLIQIVPLPVGIWGALPGKEQFAQGLATLRYPASAMPISDAPNATVLTLFAAIPAIAIFVATERLSPSPRAIAFAIVVGMVASVFVGALQVAGGPKSAAYFYEIHNPGAIGFFANQNHMAALLLVGIPMAAALVISAESKRRISAVARYGLGLGVLLLVILGIAPNASRAAIGLALPILLASAALSPALIRWRAPALILSAIVLLVGVGIIMTNPIKSNDLDPDTSGTVESRSEIWTTTGKAFVDNFPLGTGLGTFESVYHRYEDPQQVTPAYVNHAHNDYLEIALELGVGGILLIAGFLIWWALVTARMWMSTYGSPFGRAATIATGAILAHSIVDFPLRTAAISAVFAVCAAMMTQRSLMEAPSKSGEMRQSRHVSIG